MKKILIVDDTKNIRMLLQKSLELEGYLVQTAGDGKQALEMFRENKFDLAFLDIKLPEVRGTEILKRIREMGIQTPVIIITAYATVKNAVECTKMGAVAYLQKPFTADKVINVLTEIGFGNDADSGDNNTDSILANARSYIGGKEYSKALGILKSAISQDVTNPEVYLLLSKAYEGTGNMEYADKFYKTYMLFKNSL